MRLRFNYIYEIVIKIMFKFFFNVHTIPVDNVDERRDILKKKHNLKKLRNPIFKTKRFIKSKID